jgi:hypothetical protein
MDNKKASSILKSLAIGEDPETGEELNGIDLLSRPDVIRALVIGADALQNQKKKRDLPGGAGSKWTSEEEDRLALEFHSNVSITEMAKIHQRTTVAISARLVKLGLMTDRYVDPRKLEDDEDGGEAEEESGESENAVPRTKEEINKARDTVNEENGLPMRHNYPWEKDEIESIQKLFAENRPLVEISKVLQRTPRSIALKLQKLGLVEHSEFESLKDFYMKLEGINDDTQATEPSVRSAATMEEIIGRNPSEEIKENHYEVRAAGDSHIGGTREDTKRHRGRNFGEMINRR